MKKFTLFLFLCTSFLQTGYSNENHAITVFEQGIAKQKLSEMTEDELFELAHRVFIADKNCDLMTDILLLTKGRDKKEYQRLLERAAQEFADNSSVLSSIAFVYFSGDSVPQNKKIAKAFCDKALALDPTSSRAHLLLAQILIADGKEKEAIQQLEIATESLNVADKHLFFGCVQLCVLLVKHGEEEQAKQCFEKVLQANDTQKAFTAALFSIQLRNIGQSKIADIYLEKAKKCFNEEMKPASSSVEANIARSRGYMCSARVLSAYGEQEISQRFAEKAKELELEISNEANQ